MKVSTLLAQYSDPPPRPDAHKERTMKKAKSITVSQHHNKYLGVIVNEDKDGVKISNRTLHIKN